MDNDESRNAPYEKPRRIIQNQTLIQLLCVAVVVSCFHIGGLVFWLVFGICPAIVVPLVIIGWTVASLSYIGIKLYYWRKDRQISSQIT